MAYMTIKEKGAAIRAELKKLGYNSRQVSVKTGYCGYSDFAHITIKDLQADFQAVEKACTKFKSIDYDKYSGEILEGCNTYITVNYDNSVLHNAEEKIMPKIEAIISGLDKEQKNIKKGSVEYVIYKEKDDFFLVSYEEYCRIRIHAFDAESFKWNLAKFFVTELGILA